MNHLAPTVANPVPLDFNLPRRTGSVADALGPDPPASRPILADARRRGPARPDRPARPHREGHRLGAVGPGGLRVRAKP